MVPSLLLRRSTRRSSRARSTRNGTSDHQVAEPKVVLQPQDVLFGRGKGAYQSEGNRRYMQIICRSLPMYRVAVTNQDKVQITKDVLAHIKGTGGRFIDIDSQGAFYEVPDQKARIKVGQALRHKIRQLSTGDTGEKTRHHVISTSSGTSTSASNIETDSNSHRSSRRADQSTHGECHRIPPASIAISVRSLRASSTNLQSETTMFEEPLLSEAIRAQDEMPGKQSSASHTLLQGSASSISHTTQQQNIDTDNVTDVDQGSEEDESMDDFSLIALTESARNDIQKLSTEKQAE